MRVYKFLCEEHALDDLTHHKLRVSDYQDLNDPFELKGVTGYATLARHPLNPMTIHESFTRGLASSVGVICFSRSWHNPLLWSHYANKHRGICLGFDVPSDIRLDEPVYVDSPQQVSADFYLDTLTQPEFASKLDELSRQILLTKFRGWEYEDEIRMLCGKADPFIDFPKYITLQEVILGIRCQTAADTLNTALTNYRPITIINTRLSNTEFRVIEASRRSLA